MIRSRWWIAATALFLTSTSQAASPQGLEELARRLSAQGRKPYSKLKRNDGTSVSERLVFRDAVTGKTIWRLTKDESANHHPNINRTVWNRNGSRMAFRTTRKGGPGRYVMNTDGSGLQRIKTSPGDLNYGILPAWDRQNPDIMYAANRTGCYSINIKTGQCQKIATLPDERHSVFSYISEDNKYVMVHSVISGGNIGSKVYLVPTDGSGAVVSWDLAGKVKHPKHKSENDKWLHDVYFSRHPSHSIIFNFGPTVRVGEPLFFEYFPDGKYRVCYPDKSKGIPYFSHPTWNQDGSKVLYFGEPGGLIVADRDGKNPKYAYRGWIGGHCSWDNYDDEWVFASPSKNAKKVGGTILRCKTDGSGDHEILCHALTGKSRSYFAIARVIASPDGTKALYTSDMLNASGNMSMYVVIAKHPDPPSNVKVKRSSTSATISWQPPKRRREIRGYRVYRREGDGCVEVTRTVVVGNSFKDSGAPSGARYIVTSQEFSGLESRVLVGGKPIDTYAPAAPAGLRAVRDGDDGVALSWSPSAAADVDHYQLYFVRAGSAVEIHQRNLVASPERSTRQFLDWDAAPSVDGTYLLVAVDRYGNASPPAAAHLGNPGGEAAAQARALVSVAKGNVKMAPKASAASARRTAPKVDRSAVDNLATAARKRYIDRVVKAVAQGRKPRVYVDLAGRPSRAKILSADDSGLTVSLQGGEMPIPWRSISARRFAGIAAKFPADSPESRLDLVALLAGAGQMEKAAESLAEIASAEVGADLKTLRDFIQAGR